MDTIFALSSGAVPAAVAIIRVSGKQVRFGLETFTGEVPAERTAVLRSIRDRDGDLIDRGLVLFFPAPRSFTGEDCAEFHVHGGRAVVERFLTCLSTLDGFRSAEPGEFTRRAFENGRMDLTAVEGLADLIAAQTDMQRRQALDQSGGKLAQLYDDWRTRLVRIRALIEADFDFADEEDVPGSVAETIWEPICELMDEIGRHLDGSAAGQIIRDGYRIVLLGAPNAGKSSLLNALARRDIAIVSEESGTTRDILEVHLDLAGYPVNLNDTAGLREAAGAVEREGMRRALAAADTADLILVLEDSHHPVEIDISGLDEARLLRVGTKSDLTPDAEASGYDCKASVRASDGLDALLNLVAAKVRRVAGNPDMALPNRLRHREYLENCLMHLQVAGDGRGQPLELVAEELRQAGDQLGRLTGRVDVEDLLDVIFAEFCIGK